MPWTTHFSPGSAEIQFFGEVTGEEILLAKKEFFSHPFEQGPFYVLCDFSPVQKFGVSPADVRQIVEQDRQATRTHPSLAEVVAAPTLVEYGLSRMWELLMGGKRSKTNVDKTRAEALAWLEEEGVQLTPEHARELAQTRARQA
jgi:hypothetical protein